MEHDPIIALSPITVSQLHTIAGALQVALVRYPLLLQLRRWNETDIEPLSHDDVRKLRDMVERELKERTR